MAPNQSNAKESFLNCLPSAEKAELTATLEGVQWNKLRDMTITTSKGTFTNPWPNRYGFGGKEAQNWQRNVRQKGTCSSLIMCILNRS